MKKFSVLALLLGLSMFTFAGCQPTTEESTTTEETTTTETTTESTDETPAE